MAKITNYDYNRSENSLTVTYESGTIRKYSVDCIPKSTKTFIMTDIINNILSEYKQKFLDRKEEMFPRIRNEYECHQFDTELRREYSHLCSNLNYISEFSSLSLVSFVSTLSRYYIALEYGVSEARSEYSDFHHRLSSYENDYNFFSELVERFRIPVDDCSFIFTLEHLLSVAFPDSEYDEPETGEATPEQSNNTHETEETTPAVSEVKECKYCPECIYYKKCTSNAPEYMKCKSKDGSCVGFLAVCCEHFISCKSIDDIYEEQKKTEPAYEPETEDTIPEVPTPVEKTEKPDIELLSEKNASPLEIPFDMRIKHLCRICKHLKKCFDKERSKVLEYYLNHEYCGDVCGECTACCSHFKQDFKEICVNCRSCIHFRKCLASDKVYWCHLDFDSSYHCFACETDSNIECIGKYLDCYQNEFEYFDYSELEIEEVINDGDLPF